MRKRCWCILLLAAAGSFFVTLNHRAPAWAETYTHITEKGDTLWDICEKYYGDPELWPKLWQINPFVTNPHLLKPGDAIRLLEDIPAKKPLPIRKRAAPRPRRVVRKDDQKTLRTRIDVSGLTRVNANGYVSHKKATPWGRIHATDSKRIILATGDRITIAVGSGHAVKPGDQFAAYQTSSLIRHPVTRRKVGYALSFLARIVLKEQAGKGLWNGEIIENFGPVRIGAPIIPYEHLSHCIQPRPAAVNLTASIVAVKDLGQIIGHMSVVYLDRGHDDGVRRGNIFEAVKRRPARAPLKEKLPDVALGRVLVLKALPKTATGVVISMKEEFSKGAFLKSLDWEEAQRAVSDIPLCRGE
ncbi:MAG: LysM peptidoglycan-binding domain-containing protein [Deltaproteobacteria bacterium]|nr:LysM peptidoglycan-binding domain-containing protein [Deltaproteobacteria bacterium]